MITSFGHTRALSSTVVLFQVQTRGAATDHDFVQLLNTSILPVDISGWCIQYIPESGNTGSSAVHTSCVDSSTEFLIESSEFVNFASETFVADMNRDASDDLFTADVTLNGLLNHTSGHVRLLDKDKVEIDRLGWGNAVSPETAAVPVHGISQRYSRVISSENTVFDTDVNGSDFQIIELCRNLRNAQMPTGYGKRDDGTCFEDFCPNIEDVQEVAPEGYSKNDEGNCVEVLRESRVIYITELYPDAPSTDAGKEFIELYNPHSQEVNLSGYRLQVGPSYDKEYVFSNFIIPAEKYVHLSDTITKIILPNTNGVSLRLLSAAGQTVSESDIYTNAKETVSWAFVDDTWAYTNQITPSLPNLPYLEPPEDEVLGVTTILAPCAAGKYRSPDTNRCRTIETAVAQLTACDEDQYRDPNTNRCRKVATSSSLAPCGEGQERNPETNRCRTVNTLAVNSVDELDTIKDITATSASGTLNWPVISLLLTATLGYMLYEWRHELRMKLLVLRKAK